MIQRISPFEAVWNPLADAREFRRAVNRIFGPVHGIGVTFPPLNIQANEEEAVVSAEVPGLGKDDIEISIEGATVTITGSREAAEAEEGAAYVRQERFSGRFHRVVELPFKVEAGEVKAQLRNGLLVIRLPRAESDRPHKIEIRNS